LISTRVSAYFKPPTLVAQVSATKSPDFSLSHSPKLKENGDISSMADPQTPKTLSPKCHNFMRICLVLIRNNIDIPTRTANQRKNEIKIIFDGSNLKIGLYLIKNAPWSKYIS
jgi:hypothetical protein